MKQRKVLLICVTLVFAIIMSGCGESKKDNNTQKEKSEVSEALFYDNDGNNYLAVEGKSIVCKPNKTKEYGYNTDGTWTSWYETSSVITVDVDGDKIDSCGNTVIIKDKGIQFMPINSQKIEVKTDAKSDAEIEIEKKYNIDNYLTLRYWWKQAKKNGQKGKKIIMIKSQDGKDIGLVSGDKVSWEVSDNLPKATKITIDGKKMILHRATYTMIPKKMMK